MQICMRKSLFTADNLERLFYNYCCSSRTNTKTKSTFSTSFFILVTQEKLNIYPYVNGITHTNGGRLINVHERIAIVT